MTLVLFMLLSIEAAWADNPWQGKARPGFMAGDSHNETDYFIDFLLPITGTEKGIFFFNPNLRIDDQGTNEQNLGLGGRVLVNDDLVILGANAYYDAMRSDNNKEYQQWGVGFEVLTNRFDLRGNYYKPFGDSKHRIPEMDVLRFGPSSLLIAPGYEEAHEGFDAEAGVLVPGVSKYAETRVYAGGYRYQSDLVEDSRISGERYRVEIRPLPFIEINVEVRNDEMRGTDTFVGGYVEVPFDLGALFSLKNPFKTPKGLLERGTRELSARMTDKVMRDRHIVMHDHNDVKNLAATGIELIYVNADNTSPNGGKGTYGNPYADLNSVSSDPRFTDGIWVYVFSDDDVADTHYANLTLPDNSTLWGQGYRIANLGGGPRPIIDGAFSSVITLGDNNDIMGLTIQGGGHGIYGENVTSLALHDNLIQNNTKDGVHLVNYDFSADISGKDIAYFFEKNSLVNNRYNGVSVETTFAAASSLDDVTVDATFNENTFEGNDTAIDLATYIEGTEVANVNLLNTFVDNLITDGTGKDILISQDVNAIKGAFSPGSAATITNATIENTFSGNTITDHSKGGVFIWNSLYPNLRSGATTTDSLLVSIDSSSVSNTFTDNDMSGVEVYNYLSPYLYTDGSTVNGNIEMRVTNTTVANTFTNNTMDDNGQGSGTGLYVSSSIEPFAFVGNSTVGGDVTTSVDTLTITNTLAENDITNNTYYGLYLENYEGARLTTYSSSIENAAINTSNATIDNSFTGNNVTGNDGIGFYLYNDFSEARIRLMSSTAKSSETSFTATSLSDTLSGNTITGNGESMGLDYYLNGSGVPTDLMMEGNTISENGLENIRIYSDSAAGFTGDLGGGTLGSSGGNVFTNPTGNYDLYNDTGVKIDAKGNLWSDNSDPSSKINGPVGY